MVEFIDIQIAWQVTDAIYRIIFGKSRAELVEESFPHWHPALTMLHNGDLDEIIRDYMTTEALTALAHAEASVTMGIRNQTRAGRKDFCVDIASYCRQYKHEGRLWEFEGESN